MKLEIGESIHLLLFKIVKIINGEDRILLNQEHNKLWKYQVVKVPRLIVVVVKNTKYRKY